MAARRYVALAAAVGVVLQALGTFSALASSRGGPWTALRSGDSGSYSWAVKTKRGGARRGRRGPCLLVVITRRFGPHGYDRSKLRSCAVDGAALRARRAPLLAGGSQLGRAPESGLTVLAVLVAPEVRSARLELDGEGMEVPLRPLAGSESAALGVGPARLGVVTVPRGGCPTRLTSRGRAGSLLWDSGSSGCGVLGSAGTG
jgi:hypothetical protein